MKTKNGSGDSWYAMALKLANALKDARRIAGDFASAEMKGALEDFARMDDKRRAAQEKNAAKRAALANEVDLHNLNTGAQS